MENGDSRGRTSPTNIASALRVVLENPVVLSDVEIEATVDGTRLSAHRIILASRSQVFMKLFAGGFSEAKSGTVIKLSFEGTVLKAVLEYCYTDEVSFMSSRNNKDSCCCCDESMVPMVVGVASAADYFALPMLYEQVLKWSTAQMKKNPALAWSFLVEAETTSTSQADVWRARARQILAMYPEACMSSLARREDSLKLLSREALERIVSDESMTIKESSLFTLIASWASVDDDSKNKRKADAAGLVARHIHLDQMPASELATIVKPSDLVTKNQLCDAYESLATRAEQVHGASCSGMRGPHWETSTSIDYQSQTATTSCELLVCSKPMISGSKYEWSIQLTTGCESTWVGLASSGVIERARSLGSQQLGWVYGKNGSKMHAGIRRDGTLPKFEDGDTLTFILDLTAPPVSLKAYVNDGEEHTIFGHEELTPGDGEDAYSFVPAVSLKAPGAVRFCGFLPV